MRFFSRFSYSVKGARTSSRIASSSSRIVLREPSTTLACFFQSSVRSFPRPSSAVFVFATFAAKERTRSRPFFVAHIWHFR
uniref:Uncharacterized protein n=1 Tax=uncultured marine virus TaxID=186617 RepID=A0A0F7L2T4_9VIRU|nr:hypothetical protein [uncultured marine virus]